MEKTKVDYFRIVAWTAFLSLVFLASITSEAFDHCAWRLMDMIYGLLELFSASPGVYISLSRLVQSLQRWRCHPGKIGPRPCVYWRLVVLFVVAFLILEHSPV